MKIEFLCDTNYPDYVYINGVIFLLTDGREVFIDRKETDWGINYYNKVEVDFLECYIWDGENEIEVSEEEFEGARFVRFEIEDDAPDDYYIKALNVNGEDITDYDKRLDIYLKDGTPSYEAEEQFNELYNHLNLNGYNYELYKEDILFIDADDEAYYKTILDERGFNYNISNRVS